MYLDELQFIFKRGDRGGVMRYMFFDNIYRQCRQTYGHSKRLQTMNTTNLRAQLNRNLWDVFIVYVGRFQRQSISYIRKY